MDEDDSGALKPAAVNSTILDYYKKFGRKRDLEQYFSLSTAQDDIRDPTGTFWRKIKTHSDSSDSGGKRSDSSQELCRISIKCSIPEPSSSQDEKSKSKDSPSPPIIIEEVTEDMYRPQSQLHDAESTKSDDNQSQKSLDGLLDTSMNKPPSPTSSVTSQRKLEWDSLADVGYANESDRKNSASSLSTLERLALKQQYTNNDTQNEIGPPTAQSTPLEENQYKQKSKKGIGKKTTKVYKKDIEFVEFSVPQTSDSNKPAFNVNLTKHISFSVENTGSVNIDSCNQGVNVSPEKISINTEGSPQVRVDREIQTTLPKLKDNECNVAHAAPQEQKTPIVISFNTQKRRIRPKRSKIVLKKAKSKKRVPSKKETTSQDRSGQLSEAESFEYMPGHMYNQNMKTHQSINHSRSGNTTGNKSSLESSGFTTTDSSKSSKHSFTKDLAKKVELLHATLQQHCEDKSMKKILIKDIIQRLLTSKYRDDDSTTDFLSGFSMGDKIIGARDRNTTPSTSDSNKTSEEPKLTRPRKSILRMDNFNANALASTSQSAPNLPAAISRDKLTKSVHSSNTDSEISSREKITDSCFTKTSSEVLYQKYLEAFKREQAYKRHLKEKEHFLKQKLSMPTSASNLPNRLEEKVSNKVRHLVKDLINNNYDDGSGDASKHELRAQSQADFEALNSITTQRSHSVFTLSSTNSDYQNKKPNLRKKLQNEVKERSKDEHYCCCPHHGANIKIGVTDSSVQVNIMDSSETSKVKPNTQGASSSKPPSNNESPNNVARLIPNNNTGDLKYVCLCNKIDQHRQIPENFLIYKCSRLTDKGVQPDMESGELAQKNKYGDQCCSATKNRAILSALNAKNKDIRELTSSSSNENVPLERTSKSSQTNLLLKMLHKKASDQSDPSSSESTKDSAAIVAKHDTPKLLIREATRCIQTEISINPRISDPSLTDINIVNNQDCATLISERVKEIPRRNSKNTSSSKNQSDIDEPFEREEEIQEVKDDLERDAEKPVLKANDDTVHDSPRNVQLGSLRSTANTVYKKEDFTIPIEGTTVTLKVSIGAKEQSDPVNKEVCDSNKVESSEKNLPLENKNLLESVTDEITRNRGLDVDHNSNMINTKSNEYMNMFVNANKSNTLPKPIIHEKKVFLRSNTDTDKIANVNMQTELVHKKDVTTQQGFTFTLSNKDTKPKNDTQSRNEESTETVSKDSSGDANNSAEIEIEDSSHTPRSDNSQITNDNVSPRNVHKNATKEKIFDEDQPTCSGMCGNKNKEFVVESKSQKQVQYLRTASSSRDSSDDKSKSDVNEDSRNKSRKSSTTSQRSDSDPLLDMIRNITKRYSKDDLEKNKRKKCFKEIVTVLNYLLDTDDTTDVDQQKPCESCTTDTKSEISSNRRLNVVSDTKSEPSSNRPETVSEACQTRELVDKGVQLSTKRSKKRLCSTESSDIPTSTDLPPSSTDSGTCKVLNKIKRECEKYQQKRCKSHNTMKKCDVTSSTSENCDNCRRIHQCSCRLHKCKGNKSKMKPEKVEKKSVAYNLIIQTSESMISEEICDDRRPLKNIVVKVPSRRKAGNVPFKEMEAKIEKKTPDCCPKSVKMQRSRSLPNESEISSVNTSRQPQVCTVREYLELNRPDFVAKSSRRQNYLKVNKESRANERAAHTDLLSMHVDESPLSELNLRELRYLAREIGLDPGVKKRAPKFISEKEMKKHSEKIYKSLPEVTRKKEEIKKENIKRTNLLMANIFKKNLQKKALRGAVNLSNYSTIIKI